MTLSPRAERFCLGILLLIFTCFTAHGLEMFFSGDDMMNMFNAWKLNPWTMGKSLLFVWMPVYRPLGQSVYRIFYAIFGFHNLALYIFCWLLLAANVLLSWKFFRTMGLTAVQGLIALSLTLVHGNFQDLYLSAGTIYDRLWFLFTLLGLILYARMKRSPGHSLLIGFICLLSIDSKESGVALPVLLACYDAIFVLPKVRASGRLKAWLAEIAPLYCGLAVLCALFVFVRVPRTPELSGTSAYHPHASLAVWATHIAEYFTALVYQHITFQAWTAAAILIAMGAAAVLARNGQMMFGWIFFIVTITPVALITTRPGYVLYVPDIGLGLYAGAAFGLIPGLSPRLQLASFFAITAFVTWFHAHNWPGPYPADGAPEKRFTEQFRREYPQLPPHSKLLFVNDDFPQPAWDLIFNVWLLYHDRTIVVHRMIGPPEQQPKPGPPIHYDHVFAVQDGRYIELDNRDVAESVRLHILRNVAVGRELDFGRRDYNAYVVSGILDGDIADPSRWTTPHAEFKFDLYPAPAVFSAGIYIADVVSAPPIRTLTVKVNGEAVGTFPLTHSGLAEVAFPVAARQITLNGFTIVDMDVDNPYKNAAGQEFGVVLMRAGFEYKEPALRRMQ